MCGLGIVVLCDVDRTSIVYTTVVRNVFVCLYVTLVCNVACCLSVIFMCV